MPEPTMYIPTVRVVQAEGERVAFLTCKMCGVSLLIDPAIPFDVAAKHEEWHILNS